MTDPDRVVRYAEAIADAMNDRMEGLYGTSGYIASTAADWLLAAAAVMPLAAAEQAERDKRWVGVAERTEAVEAQARELKGRVSDLIDECIRQKRRAIKAERALARVEALCDQWAQKPDLFTSGASIQAFIRVAIEGPDDQ